MSYMLKDIAKVHTMHLVHLMVSVVQNKDHQLGST